MRRSPLLAVACFLALVSRVIADGPYWQIDPTFAPVLESSAQASGSWTGWASPGGKFLVPSSATSVINGSISTGWLTRLNPDGQVDASFHAPVLYGQMLAVYPDGRILYAEANGSSTSIVVRRMLADGSNDATFAELAVNGGTQAVLLTDGDVILWGSFTKVGGVDRLSLARINGDGTLDEAFQSPFTLPNQPSLLAVAACVDGKVLVSGYLPYSAGRNRLVRLESTGAIDESFVPAELFNASLVTQFIPETDGRVVAVTVAGNLYRLDATGANDASFAPAIVGDPVECSGRLTDGKIYYTTEPNSSQVELRRLNSDYSADTGFTPVVTSNQQPLAIGLPVVGDDNSLYVGMLTPERRQARQLLTRLSSTGQIDANFNPRFSRTTWPAAQLLQPDGKVVIAGAFDRVNGAATGSSFSLVRLNANGTLDEAFAPILPEGASITNLWSGPEDAVIAFGSFPVVGEQAQRLRRFLSSGAVQDGTTAITSALSNAAMDSAGRLYASTGTGLARYSGSGVADAGFTPAVIPGLILGIFPGADNATLVAYRTSMAQPDKIVRLLADGTLDSALPAQMVNGFLTAVRLPNGDALILSEESVSLFVESNVVTGHRILVQRLRSQAAAIDADTVFSFRSKVYSNTLASLEVELTLGGLISDLTKQGGSGPATLFGAGAPLNWEMNCFSDEKLLVRRFNSFNSPMTESFVRYVRTTSSGPSFDGAPTIASWDTFPKLLPQNLPYFMLATPEGIAPFTYQWLKNGEAIDGATAATLQLGKIKGADSGDYSLRVTNAFGTATSPVRSVTVDPTHALPSLSVALSDTSVVPGGGVVLAPAFAGDAPLSYQWYFNGAPLPGQTGATLSLDNLQGGNAGTYRVVASNSFFLGSGFYNGSAETSANVFVGLAQAAPQFTCPAIGVIGMNNFIATTTSGFGAVEWAYGSGTPTANTNLEPATGLVIWGSPGTTTLKARFLGDATHLASPWSPDFTLTVVAVPPTFDYWTYRVLNPDVNANFRTEAEAWGYYLNTGIYDGHTDGDFDVHQYLAQYPDLAARFGNDLVGAALHWYTTGRKEGLRIPAGFDVNGYFARNQDIAWVFANDKYGAWLHYYNYGVFEGRSFDANFIPAEYLELNQDLKRAGGGDLKGAVMHWLSYGHPVEDRMGRVPIGFNVDNYLARYPDLAAGFASITPVAVRNVAVWQHFLDYGAAEGRSDGDFDIYSYLAGNPDVAVAVNNNPRSAALHWFFYGRREGRRIPGGFNVQNYRTLYPDLVVFGGDDLYGSWIHYRDVGVLEGRYYDDTFRPADYLALNPDIAAIIGNNYRDALLHWLYYGQYEGRQGRY